MMFLPLLVALSLAAVLLVCIAIDRRKHRAPPGGLPVSVIIPCYNDAPFVRRAVESVFASWPGHLLDVQVVNDGSRDDSNEVIAGLARLWPIRIIDDGHNRGKSARLNAAARDAAHEPLLFLDADTELNPAALREMLARLHHSPRVGAVSSPCTPRNRGFLPAMQALEYNMHRLGMGACNLTSVQALWGGCLLTRRSVFLSLRGFVTGALAEDSDYAFRLNLAGHRVEQGFAQVRTEVPDTPRVWIRQKIRWTAGLCQCAFRYPRVWLGNPVIVASLGAYGLLTLNGLYGLFDNVSPREMFLLMHRMLHNGIALHDLVGQLLAVEGGLRFVVNLLTTASMGALTLLYVIPLVNRQRDLLKFIWLIPFLLAYLPAFLLVSGVGFIVWAQVLRKAPSFRRAW